jgi:hypothetical protein
MCLRLCVWPPSPRKPLVLGEPPTNTYGRSASGLPAGSTRRARVRASAPAGRDPDLPPRCGPPCGGGREPHGRLQELCRGGKAQEAGRGRRDADRCPRAAHSAGRRDPRQLARFAPCGCAEPRGAEGSSAVAGRGDWPARRPRKHLCRDCVGLLHVRGAARGPGAATLEGCRCHSCTSRAHAHRWHWPLPHRAGALRVWQ